ncbi:hypothetical protein B0H10DRAFT_1879968 [Mycena sp. CBHHK59/15]|nr:hypothetical protein B0H10DRAFT_1879968 [Mycena sp. CBHHK59/15]
MCSYEVVTDRYTVCQHLVKIYATGNSTDCGYEGCKTSSAHKHKAPNCGCMTYQSDDVRIRNQFRTYCPTCLESMPATSSRSRR